jgi:hypothetical protein
MNALVRPKERTEYYLLVKKGIIVAIVDILSRIEQKPAKSHMVPFLNHPYVPTDKSRTN